MGTVTTSLSRKGKTRTHDNVVFVIGKNCGTDELALIENKHAETLSIKSNINSLKTNIKSIQSGNEFTIYHGNNDEILDINGNPSIVSFSSSIKYFQCHDIKIKKVFINICGQSVFWLSNKNKVYGNGINNMYQLGLGDVKHREKPKYIYTLQTNANIIDIQSARLYSIALCSYSNYGNIIKYWTRRKKCNLSIPNDVINIIVMFYSLNKLYSTGCSRYGGHCDGNIHKRFWSEIEYFDNHNIQIIKLCVGYYHTLCLDTNGNLWSCGNNDYGQLGVGHLKTISADSMYPTSIKYFIRYKIKIREIKCGHSHNMVIDHNKRVWSWGNNEHAQCGHDTITNVNKPKLIEMFKKKKYKIINIQCGTWHSAACNDKNQWFLWGSNVYNECIGNDDTKKGIIKIPHCINDIVKKINDYKTIEQVSLGNHNTKILVSY